VVKKTLCEAKEKKKFTTMDTNLPGGRQGHEETKMLNSFLSLLNAV
jgi:hypothetical protein